MKKNVLQMIGSFNLGGSERQAVGLTRLLADNGAYNVSLATLNREGPLLGEAAGFEPIPEFKLNSFYDLNFLRQVRICADHLRENKIDIIHTHDFYTNIFGMLAARRAGVKTRIASKRETGGMRSGLQKRAEKFAFGLANSVVVNSAAVKDHLAVESVSDSKIHVIYNGLDLERLKPSSKDRVALCESLGLPVDPSARFITLVANLRHEVKNQPMFLRAAAAVVNRFPDTHFVLAGEGDLRRGFEKRAEELGIAGNTHFIGRCDALGDLLSVSYAGVLTSFAEGFSNSIIEYMACGLPVVATNVGGAAEAVVEGETGYLIKSNDHDALAARLIELLGDEKKAAHMGEAGRVLAREKFSLDAQLANTLELYNSLIEEGLA